MVAKIVYRRQPRRERERRLAILAFVDRLVLRRQDQRRTRIVNEDAVGLVDDGVVKTAQDETFVARSAAAHSLEREMHSATSLRHCDAVSEIVEGELLVAAIGDRSRVGLTTLGRGHALRDATDGQAEKLVNRTHFLGIAFTEIVAYGDDAHRMTRQRDDAGGQRRGPPKTPASRVSSNDILTDLLQFRSVRVRKSLISLREMRRDRESVVLCLVRSLVDFCG